MTNEELIQAVRAEIDRRIRIQEYWVGKTFPGTELAFAVKEELKQLLSFLSNLESEKPLGLEEDFELALAGEIERFITTDCVNKFPKFPEIARHFAKWGVEHLRKKERL